MDQKRSREIKGDILIVDDDLISLRLLSNLLAVHGYEIRSARDGSTALMMIAAAPPDMVLLDIQMPGMDGYQVCKQLKSNPESQDIPVLFISGRDGVFDKIKGFDAGAVDYIHKPCREEEILARIKTHLTISSLQGTLVERINELSVLHHISNAMATTQDLPQALEDVCKTITHLFEARLAVIILQVKDSAVLKGLIGYERSGRIISSADTEATLLNSSIFQSLYSEGIPDVFTDLPSMPFPEPIQMYIQEYHLQSGLIIPLIARTVSLGILILARDQIGSRFDKNEIELAETIAADIAAAINNERLTEQARLAAVDAERQRLARELHDSVTQSIYSLTLLSSGWESMARQGILKDPVDSFQRLGAVGQQALREMRLLVHQMRTPALEEEGLVKAIQQRLDAVERRANIDAQLVAHGDLTTLPRNIEDELFKIAQEALNNSLKHARAESVRVYIEEDQGQITLCIEDDGVGFNTSAKYAGMGLVNMQDRANSIASALTIQSEVAYGTQITVSLEVPKEIQEK